jgi:preprotein translocase subunit SecE
MNLGKFVREVRQETAKVTWPSRAEATQATIMVLVMVFLVALFFFLLDSVLGWAVAEILGFGGRGRG